MNPFFCEWPREVTLSFGKRIRSRSDGVRKIMVWQDALHEEADNRILVHVKDMMVQNDCKSLRIRTIDTDVVVIMLTFMPYLMFHDSGVEVLIDFGTGDHRRIISLNRSLDSLGYSLTKALLFFHAFTGCDSTSSFFGKTKTFCFN